MEGFLWLITQMALLLTSAAVVFFWLGWRWRAQDARKVEKALQDRIDAESKTVQAALEERDEARQKAESQLLTETRLKADLQEANDHRRNLERELIRVHDDLKNAQRDARQAGEDLASAQAALAPLQDEVTKLQQELQALHKKLARLEEEAAARPAAPPTESPEAPAIEVPATKEAKPKRTTKPKEAKKPATPRAARTAKTFDDPQATLARLEADITSRRLLLQNLSQERDDWQRRVASLREKGKDPTGLNLAQKSLARAEKEVTEASQAITHLEHQQTSLRRSLEQAASITQDDDLTQIKGIKSVLRDHLHAFGIRSFQQIAAWTDDDVEAFSELLAFKDRAKRDEWVRQARELLAKA